MIISSSQKKMEKEKEETEESNESKVKGKKNFLYHLWMRLIFISVLKDKHIPIKPFKIKNSFFFNMRWDLTMLTKLVLNSCPQSVLLLQPPKVLGFQAWATACPAPSPYIFFLRLEKAKFFHKWPGTKYFRLCGPYSLFVNYSVLPL